MKRSIPTTVLTLLLALLSGGIRGSNLHAQGFVLERQLIPRTSFTTSFVAGPTTTSQFGSEVVTSGNYAAVRAGGFMLFSPDRNAVYVYERIGGQWSLAQELRPDDPLAFTSFGSDLDIDGETLVVGLPRSTGGGLVFAGTVEVYERNPASGAWIRRATIASPTPQETALFGFQVALSGTTLAVGAGFEDDERGAIYVFERDPLEPNNWVFQQRLQLDPSRAQLGRAIDLHGDTLVATSKTTLATSPRAHVFERDDPSGDWSEVSSHAGQNQTSRIAVGEDVFVFCGPSTQPLNPPGFAYAYERDASGDWTVFTVLIDLVTSPFIDRTMYTFGADVAIDGDTIVIGGYQFASGSPVGGTAYVFERSAPGTWSLGQRVQAPGRTYDDDFGFRVAYAAGQLLVGAPDDDVLGEATGSVFAFSR